jgi:predicted DNA binding CopG/RHH family protein
MATRKLTTKKSIPHFATEDAERRFWATHDTTDYFDWDRAVGATFPNLKPTTAAISIRLPVSMLNELKALANAQDVPYQSLMKMYLSERLTRERARKKSTG